MNYLELSRQEKADLVGKYLKEDYPTVRSPLFHRNAFEFLISVMLSPQTNDVTTNKVTPGLFEKYPTPEALASADIEDVIKLIRLVNYHRTKAQRIIETSQMLIDNFDSKVPHTMTEMLTLKGVGRKVANVILNDWYATSEEVNPPYPTYTKATEGQASPLLSGEGIDPNAYNSIVRGSINPTGYVVDTHVMRVSQALKLTDAKTPDKIESDLMQIFPIDEWMPMSLRMIYHGREVFQAKNPLFENFPKWKEIYEQLLNIS